ncbi:hypothetical protein QC763_401290 [Podospora pseudopauciseta]|uniref:SGNH hydrolase-type esterase domain-containing protein n=1 Tax=Podospora pseudopauciseta TaxID=2093780 RepID=A0ABR0HBJ7_9PEZI|nr:hypothetical protein QC763_401290 [Podospora pseudopauciseta]
MKTCAGEPSTQIDSSLRLHRATQDSGHELWEGDKKADLLALLAPIHYDHLLKQALQSFKMQLYNLLTIALAGLAAASPVQLVERQQKLRIMPLGDSITEIACWRAFVWDQIAAAGFANQVQYVGSQNSNPQGCRPTTTNWDQRHEGHSGWLAIDIANNYLANWLRSTPADIVQFMLGTNDVFRGRSTNDIIAAYTKMVQIMRAANPKMKIIVDLVIPLGVGSNSGIQALNARIPAWAAGLNTTESPIVIADCNTGYKTSDLRDGVHPSIAGDQFLATKIGPPLLNYIRESLAGN